MGTIGNQPSNILTIDRPENKRLGSVHRHHNTSINSTQLNLVLMTILAVSLVHSTKADEPLDLALTEGLANISSVPNPTAGALDSALTPLQDAVGQLCVGTLSSVMDLRCNIATQFIQTLQASLGALQGDSNTTVAAMKASSTNTIYAIFNYLTTAISERTLTLAEVPNGCSAPNASLVYNWTANFTTGGQNMIDSGETLSSGARCIVRGSSSEPTTQICTAMGDSGQALLGLANSVPDTLQSALNGVSVTLATVCATTRSTLIAIAQAIIAASTPPTTSPAPSPGSFPPSPAPSPGSFPPSPAPSPGSFLPSPAPSPESLSNSPASLTTLTSTVHSTLSSIITAITTPSEEAERDSLSTGAIAGIVITVLIAIGLASYYFCRRNGWWICVKPSAMTNGDTVAMTINPIHRAAANTPPPYIIPLVNGSPYYSEPGAPTNGEALYMEPIEGGNPLYIEREAFVVEPIASHTTGGQVAAPTYDSVLPFQQNSGYALFCSQETKHSIFDTAYEGGLTAHYLPQTDLNGYALPQDAQTAGNAQLYSSPLTHRDHYENVLILSYTDGQGVRSYYIVLKNHSLQSISTNDALSRKLNETSGLPITAFLHKDPNGYVA